jgi:two-component system, OmpR family, response regulator
MNTQNTYSVFLVDDDKMFLTSLRNNLQQKFGNALKISEFSSGEECLESMEKHKNENSPPDIVILDYYLNNEAHPDAINGVKVLTEIKSMSDDTTVIMLSGEDKMQVAIDCVKHGAYEYVVKSESAFIRIEQAMKNSMETIQSAKKSTTYFRANIVFALIILAIILVDVIWYYSYHYTF